MDGKIEDLRYFEYEHLPDNLQRVAAPLCTLTRAMYHKMPDNEQRKLFLQKMLEAKDCAMRCVL